MARSHVLIVLISMALTIMVVSAQNKPDLTIPDRTVIPAVLRTSIDARDVKVGKELELAVAEDVRDSTGKLLIPKQAKLTGRVTEAVQWAKDKPESRLSIVVEKAEWKKHSVNLRAFVAGDLKIYTAGGHPEQGVSETVAALTRTPTAQLPVNTTLSVDSSVTLQMATSKELVTELVSPVHDVRIEQGSKFLLRQLNP
ncbi:MAG TPA: hypothetical protein VFJ47_05380 [Terriglobales bacterium]|nr:hypothetical protein [Terriglobales bacterium]